MYILICRLFLFIFGQAKDGYDYRQDQKCGFVKNLGPGIKIHLYRSKKIRQFIIIGHEGDSAQPNIGQKLAPKWLKKLKQSKMHNITTVLLKEDIIYEQPWYVFQFSGIFRPFQAALGIFQGYLLTRIWPSLVAFQPYGNKLPDFF